MGGSNDPSNIIEVTVEEHAELHRRLYMAFGFIQDKIAWKMLLGQANDPVVWAMKSRLGAAVANRNGSPGKGTKWWFNPNDPTQRKMIKEGVEPPTGWERGRGKNTWAANRDYKNVSEEHRKKTSESAKQAWSDGKCDHRLSPLGNYNGRRA